MGDTSDMERDEYLSAVLIKNEQYNSLLHLLLDMAVCFTAYHYRTMAYRGKCERRSREEMLLKKKTFVNKDGSTGELYLVSSDLTLTDLWNIYQKRWCIEEYHKSIKSNTLLTKSPTKTIKTQKNHIFCSIVAYNKLEILKIREKLNHFQIKKKLYYQALKASYEELKIINKSYSFLMI